MRLRPLLAAMLLSGCAGPASDAAADASAGADSGGSLVEEPPCTPVAAVYFDLGETLVVERDDGLFEDVYGSALLVDALDALGIPLGIVTNVPRAWDLDDVRALLVDPSLLDRFDVVLLSSEAEARQKPDPAIFTEAIALLAEPPPAAQVLFVTEDLADLADADPPTEGARAAGLVGVHLSDAEPSPLADRTVATADLSALADAPWVACLEAE